MEDGTVTEGQNGMVVGVEQDVLALATGLVGEEGYPVAPARGAGACDGVDTQDDGARRPVVRYANQARAYTGVHGEQRSLSVCIGDRMAGVEEALEKRGKRR
eukprot:COSAG01_NODE_41635_length_449_cov_0.528571_1_plen_102_part_00